MSSRITRRRKTMAILGAAAVGVLGLGVYATLLTVTAAGGFAAGSQDTAAGCDTAVIITPDTPVWNDATGQYEIDGATVSGLDDTACVGAIVTVDAINTLGASVGHASSTAITAAQTTKVVAFTPVEANSIASYAIIIA